MWKRKETEQERVFINSPKKISPAKRPNQAAASEINSAAARIAAAFPK